MTVASPSHPRPDRGTWIAFGWSIALHASVVAALIILRPMLTLPEIALSSGTGGDGVRPGDVVVVSQLDAPDALDEAQLTPFESATSPLPATNVRPETSREVDVSEPDSTTPAPNRIALPPTMSDAPPQTEDTGWIGPRQQATNRAVPPFGPSRPSRAEAMAAQTASDAPPQERALPSKPTAHAGDGGTGGDARAVEALKPSARNRPPHYPVEARRRGYEGTVMLEIDVRLDGKVGRIAVTSSSGFTELDAAAVQAVRDWHFEPGRDGGHVSECTLQMPVRFVLRG